MFCDFLSNTSTPLIYISVSLWKLQRTCKNRYLRVQEYSHDAGDEMQPIITHVHHDGMASDWHLQRCALCIKQPDMRHPQLLRHYSQPCSISRMESFPEWCLSIFFCVTLQPDCFLACRPRSLVWCKQALGCSAWQRMAASVAGVPSLLLLRT